MASNFPNLPGIVVDLQDGNLRIPPTVTGPITLVLGTSSTGPAGKMFLVTDPSSIENAFSKDGTLVRGMIEAQEGGARTLALYRIGASPAIATGVAHTNAASTGFTIQTAVADNTAGTSVSVSWDAVKDILYLYDVATNELVWCNDPDAPLNMNTVAVSGSSTSAVDIGVREDTSLNVVAGEFTVTIAATDVTAYYSAGDFVDVTTSSLSNKINEGSYRVGSVVFSTNTVITFNAKTGTPGWGGTTGTGWELSETGAITLRHNTPVTLESLGQDSIAPEAFTDVKFGSMLASMAVLVGGSYSAGATEYALVGGTFHRAATITIDSVTGGPPGTIATFTIVDKGSYYGTLPTTLAMPSGAGTFNTLAFTVNHESALAIADTVVNTDLLWIEADQVEAESGFYYVKGTPGSTTTNGFPQLATTSGGASVAFVSTTGTAYDAAKISGTTFTIKENISTGGNTATKLFVGQRVYLYTDIITERGYYYVKAVSNAAASVLTFTSTSVTSGTAVTFTSTKARIFDLAAWDYTVGTDGVDMDYRTTYEELAKAFLELEAVQVDVVTAMNTYLDVPNVADDALLSHSDDALLYLRTTESAGELVFDWLDQTELDALVVSDPDLAAEYHEVNFAYQLARYCYTIDRNEHSCIGTIGVVPPVGFFRSQLATWYGALPGYNSVGQIISNGSGLLGNKLMVGTLTHDPGFFATDSDEMDGVTLKDDGNKSIDIGKYLSVCATPIFARNSFLGGLGYVASFAPTYAGIISALPPNVGGIKQILKASAVTAFTLHKETNNDLVGSRYVMLKVNQANQSEIIDSPTAATSGSDYQRLSTVRIVADAVQAARDIANPYLGKLQNQATREALQAAENRMLKGKMDQNFINPGSAAIVTATRSQEIQGKAVMKLILIPALELRQIRIVVSLS